MYVSALKISGVRGFSGAREVELDFTRPDPGRPYAGWTVLAGRNGSGKSTLLQAIALCLAGPRIGTDVDAWADTASAGVEVRVTHDPDFDQTDLFSSVSPEDAIPVAVRWDEDGLSSWDRNDPRADTLWSPKTSGWFFAGYGPFRRLSNAEVGQGDRWRRNSASSTRTLFDEDAALVEGVSWLVEQHLYRLEKRRGAQDLLDSILELLRDGLLPDGMRIDGVDSDGLWVSGAGQRRPLRQMSDGYRAVTALVLDIVRQLAAAYPSIAIEYRNGVPTLPYPGVVLIDEVDAHLHVSWQKKIGEWLKTHFPAIQFIVTSHSPYICQSADPGGLIRLPGPEEPDGPRVVGQDLYERVVYGSGDDAILTELFGVDTPLLGGGRATARQAGGS